MKKPAAQQMERVQCDRTKIISRGGASRKFLSEVASSNIHIISSTLDTFHLLSGWLKDLASANIRVIFVTLDTFQLSSGWLTVRGTQALVSFAPLAFKLFCAARQNAVLRRSPFPSP